MNTPISRWNEAALKVPMGSDPDRDARYAAIRRREFAECWRAHDVKPSWSKRLARRIRRFIHTHELGER